MAQPNHRYDDIMRRLAARKREQAAPQQHDLAAILDGLNAWGALEALRKKRLPALQIYGPASVRNARAIGVVLWYKTRGYYHYRTLHLLGIWAYEADGAAFVTLGTKALTFTGAVYNPESYFHHITRRFDIYYDDDGSPPAEPQRLLSAVYRPADRLTLRDALRGALAEWVQAHDP